MNKKPLLSVFMVTYNHEEYIAEAIESVLKQKTQFSFELIIGEDCSKDTTREIVEQYALDYPEKISAILNPKNLGAQKNSRNVYEKCRGKYIAILEGDDYWTDPYKLQKQVDFLEAHPEFAICFHNARKLFQATGDSSSLIITNLKKNVFTIEHIIKENFIPTLTCVFRNNLFKEFPDWYYNAFPGDWALHILNAQYGKIKYMDEVMATYRLHDGGMHSGNIAISNYEGYIKTFESIAKGKEIKHEKIVSYTISRLYSELSRLYLKEKRYSEAKIALLKCLKKYRFNSFKEALKIVLLIVNIFLRIKK